jgi:glycine oxidase
MKCMSRRSISDVVIAGGGIIGLSLGLELRQRGLSVVVLERKHAMQSASWAAGGMLAAHDPENPPALLPLSLRSLEIYPAYLERIQTLSHRSVSIRTRRTLQQIRKRSNGENRASESRILEEAVEAVPGLRLENVANEEYAWMWLNEESLDPRDLCRALPAAFLAEKGSILEGTPVLGVERTSSGVIVETAREPIHAGTFVNCCGAWAGELRLGGIPVEPVKGQMVTVSLASARLRCVLRTPEFYAIPRGDGRVAIGATTERAGFDPAVDEQSIAGLVRLAAEHLPEISGAPRLESWAGFRPGTPDGLPILGAAAIEHCWHATGHYRNGILLAPVTARSMARAILGDSPEIALDAFSPTRFTYPASAKVENFRGDKTVAGW